MSRHECAGTSAAQHPIAVRQFGGALSQYGTTAFYGATNAWVSDLKRVLREQGQPAFWNKRLEALRARTKDPLILAGACAMANRKDEALDFLDQAYREHHDYLGGTLKTDPEWDSLRGEPRFKALLKAMKFPE